ncbi:hypothetical protein JTB14_011064 [Gonioctena quinquepunctata]|nr:hypothetical protein JTB14_011064 [Gonioctena quinquepunctata]
MSSEDFYDIIRATTMEELKNETENSKHEEKSKEWKLLLNIFRKFSSQVSNAETQEVIEDHSVIELDRFNNDDFYSEEEINDMPVVEESHPNNDIEEILILETNEEGLEKEYENNTLQLISLPSTSNDEASTRNEREI